MGFYPLETMTYARTSDHSFSAEWCGKHPETPGSSKPTEKCRGVKYTFDSLTDAVSSGWHFSYGNRIKDFQAIMEHMHCVPVKHGDIAYQLEIFPDYLVQMILWEGDDEFPPSSQILFSDNFPISFQAEDMAVMGDVIIGSLKSFAKCI